MADEIPYMGPNRRSSPRLSVNLTALWHVKDESRKGTIADLSAIGCFILTGDPAKEGELVRIELSLPSGERITLWGNVVYGVEEIGFGVQFSHFMGEDDRRKFELLLQAESRRRNLRGGR